MSKLPRGELIMPYYKTAWIYPENDDFTDLEVIEAVTCILRKKNMTSISITHKHIEYVQLIGYRREEALCG